MNTAWFFREDWPQEHELKRRATLMNAIRNIPGGSDLTEEDIEHKALSLWRMSDFGRDEEKPRNRPASQKASENELRKLNDLAEKLALHIRKMHRPAISALYSEGCYIFHLERELQSVQHHAHYAFSTLDVEETVRGAGKKLEAAYVAETAASVFEHVAGRRPTYTTNPIDNEISGAWPDFLKEVFSALWIDASVAAQVKAISQKSAAD